MSAATVAVLISVIETIIQETPQAIAMWNSIKTILNQGTDPTPAQWASLVTALTAAHQKVQAA